MIVSARQKLDQIDNINDLIKFLLENKPERLDDACFDTILVDFLFPILDEKFFKGGTEISEQQIQKFLETLNYQSLGLVKEDLIEDLKKKKSINRIIDTIVSKMPKDKKDQIVVDHIRKLWYEQNAKGNLAFFKQSLNPDYWGF